MLAILAIAALAVTDNPDGVVSTAPAGQQSVAVGAVAPVAGALPSASGQPITAQELTTDQQIDRWIAARNTDVKPFATSSPAQDDRKMHGWVSASIGTNDFSAYSATVSLPIGETGRLELSYRQSRNDPFAYGYGYGYRNRGLGYGGYGQLGDGRSYSLGAHLSFDDQADRVPPVWDRHPLRWRREATGPLAAD